MLDVHWQHQAGPRSASRLQVRQPALLPRRRGLRRRLLVLASTAFRSSLHGVHLRRARRTSSALAPDLLLRPTSRTSDGSPRLVSPPLQDAVFMKNVSTLRRDGLLVHIHLAEADHAAGLAPAVGVARRLRRGQPLEDLLARHGLLVLPLLLVLDPVQPPPTAAQPLGSDHRAEDADRQHAREHCDRERDRLVGVDVLPRTLLPQPALASRGRGGGCAQQRGGQEARARVHLQPRARRWSHCSAHRCRQPPFW
mmetsp:Transcript_3854/g.10276  ORF Transcript_3854/g.10276 Transcript_3854/m.10276 type:complete len:253 (-) Transcript_3854:57-815(-)